MLLWSNRSSYMLSVSIACCRSSPILVFMGGWLNSSSNISCNAASLSLSSFVIQLLSLVSGGCCVPAAAAAATTFSPARILESRDLTPVSATLSTVSRSLAESSTKFIATCPGVCASANGGGTSSPRRGENPIKLLLRVLYGGEVSSYSSYCFSPGGVGGVGGGGVSSPAWSPVISTEGDRDLSYCRFTT